jgi:DNA-binding NarL/FixJ family response regulator
MSIADATRTYIAHRSAIVLERVMAMLAEVPGVEVVGQSSDLAGALDSLWHLDPDVVIMDAYLPGAVEALKSVNRQKPATVVVILIDLNYPQYRNWFHLAGADIVLDLSREFTRLGGLLQELTGTHRDESEMRSQPQVGST